MIRVMQLSIGGLMLLLTLVLNSGSGQELNLEASEPVELGRLWILYAASDSDHDTRMIGWWKNGWDRFARSTIPNHVAALEATTHLRVYGIQVHHPWGRTVVEGKPRVMEFDQRARCYREFQQTGNETLQLALDDRAFYQAMSDISEHHRLMIYTGSPHMMRPLPGEDQAAWIRRAKQMYGPALQVHPPPAIGMDATIGQPHSDDPDNKYYFTGGENGAVAGLVRDLTGRGHEVFFESGILFKAKWALELCSTYTTKQHWHVVQYKRINSNRSWGRWAKPQAETGGTAMIQLILGGKSDQEKQDEIWKQLRLGRDVAIPPPSLPGYPWKG